jgi:hypothetical protein
MLRATLVATMVTACMALVACGGGGGGADKNPDLALSNQRAAESAAINLPCADPTRFYNSNNNNISTFTATASGDVFLSPFSFSPLKLTDPPVKVCSSSVDGVGTLPPSVLALLTDQEKSFFGASLLTAGGAFASLLNKQIKERVNVIGTPSEATNLANKTRFAALTQNSSGVWQRLALPATYVNVSDPAVPSNITFELTATFTDPGYYFLEQF